MRGLKQREYPLGFRLILAQGNDDDNGTPWAKVTLELVEEREGNVYVCGDSPHADNPLYLNWLAAEERHYLLSWSNTQRRAAYDELSHDRRFGGSYGRIYSHEAIKLGKTLEAIDKAMSKAQDVTQLSVSTFEGYLRNLLVAMKPAFLVYRGQRRPANDAELVILYRELVAQIEFAFTADIERHHGQAA